MVGLPPRARWFVSAATTASVTPAAWCLRRKNYATAMPNGLRRLRARQFIREVDHLAAERDRPNLQPIIELATRCAADPDTGLHRGRRLTVGLPRVPSGTGGVLLRAADHPGFPGTEGVDAEHG